MAVAKCRRCRATVSVRLENGAWATGCGDSFRSRCMQRTKAGTVAAPDECGPMREAIARAQHRAEREAASIEATPPSTPLPGPARKPQPMP